MKKKMRWDKESVVLETQGKAISSVLFSVKFLVHRIVADPEYGAQNFVEGVNYYLINEDD